MHSLLTPHPATDVCFSVSASVYALRVLDRVVLQHRQKKLFGLGAQNDHVLLGQSRQRWACSHARVPRASCLNALFRFVTENLQSDLVQQLYAETALDTLLKESDDIASQRCVCVCVRARPCFCFRLLIVQFRLLSS